MEASNEGGQGPEVAVAPYMEWNMFTPSLPPPLPLWYSYMAKHGIRKHKSRTNIAEIQC